MKDLIKMAWQLPSDYSPPDIEAIKTDMRFVKTPSVGGTYLAMKPIVFDGKTPFLSYDGIGETDTDAPLKPDQARRAFTNRWVVDDLVAAVKSIAEDDEKSYEADN